MNNFCNELMLISDENRDINMHVDEDIKRQRLTYSSDQIYSNIWSGKWCIKDEHKLLSELGTLTTNSSSVAAYYDTHSGFPTTVASHTHTANVSDSMLYDSITSISGTQSSLYTPAIGASIGGNTLTPLVPISMQDIKIGQSLQDQTLSPYYSAVALENTNYSSLANVDNSIHHQQSNEPQLGIDVTNTAMDLPMTILDRNEEPAITRCVNQRALNHSNSTKVMKEKNSPVSTATTNVGTIATSEVQATKILTIKNLNNENRQISTSSNFDNNNHANANHSSNSNNNTSQNSTITSLILLQPLNKTHNPPISGTSTIGRNECYINTASTTVLPTCSSVVPTTDYAYSPTYAQYGNAYGTYGYGSSTGLLNSYYYEGVQSQTTSTTALNQEIRSPLAATRANSLASAASPTGSACTKSESSDIFLV
uniref:Uncharacterized protein n=1 Tax=Glossina brevipalpis TaxID=37001 RepID=A0A1A9WYB1_9MUSC